MKRKTIIIVISVTVVALICLGAWYYTSYPTIGVTKSVALSSDNFTDEFHRETISVVAAGNDCLPDSPLQKKKLDEVWEWNNAVSFELTEYSKKGGKAFNIVASGQINDDKTTLKYEGYI